MKPEDISEAEMSALFSQEDGGQPSPQAPVFPVLERAGELPGDSLSIGLLANVELEVTVFLGQTRRSIKDILALGPGSVLELDRLAGEAVDVLVNGRLVATGEVVVIGENFGVRITELVKNGGGRTK